MSFIEHESRDDPPTGGPEKEMLIGWLDFHRATLAIKCEGLSPAQLCERSVPPSSMSLIGLVRHMAEVERNWFQRVMEGHHAPPRFYDENDPDGDFDNVAPESTDGALEAWREDCRVGDEVIAAHDLDDLAARENRGRRVSLRWIMVHMIEEYARHNGHADFLRERIDGATGD